VDLKMNSITSIMIDAFSDDEKDYNGCVII